LRTRTSLDRFASLFWCSYEPESQFLRYVNAGHLPPILVRQNAGGEIDIERLTEDGPVLGLQKADYRQGQASVCPGDLLVLELSKRKTRSANSLTRTASSPLSGG
jgi:sigma-B regulation protein RsbU (phosphoserine phosphatase)